MLPVQVRVDSEHPGVRAVRLNHRRDAEETEEKMRKISLIHKIMHYHKLDLDGI